MSPHLFHQESEGTPQRLLRGNRGKMTWVRAPSALGGGNSPANTAAGFPLRPQGRKIHTDGTFHTWEPLSPGHSERDGGPAGPGPWSCAQRVKRPVPALKSLTTGHSID